MSPRKAVPRGSVAFSGTVWQASRARREGVCRLCRDVVIPGSYVVRVDRGGRVYWVHEMCAYPFLAPPTGGAGARP